MTPNKMKFFSLLTAKFFLIFLSAHAQNETIITGKIDGNATELIYSNPKQGTCYMGFRDTIQISGNRKFELRFRLSQPTFIVLWTNGERRDCKLLIEPGKKYNLLFEEGEPVIISGANEIGQQLYAALPNSSFIDQHAASFEKENSPANIRSIIHEIKSAEIKKFSALVLEKNISASFFELVKKDRDCYYAL